MPIQSITIVANIKNILESVILSDIDQDEAEEYLDEYLGYAKRIIESRGITFDVNHDRELKGSGPFEVLDSDDTEWVDRVEYRKTLETVLPFPVWYKWYTENME